MTTKTLKNLLPQGTFFLTQSQAQKIAAELKLQIPELMRQLVPLVKERSRPVISHYQVGAVAKAKDSGNLIFGVNVEFSQLALNQSIHSEQFVIARAHSLGETGIEAFALSAAPCGHCRQFLNELDSPSEMVFHLPQACSPILKELLPYAFGPEDLGVKGRLLNPLLHKWKLGEKHRKDPLIETAYQASLRSYSPYTHSPAGVALELKDGKILSGSYLENVAFNPSLSPLQTALANLIAEGREYLEIKRLVLVERSQQDGISSQKEATESLLRTIAPLAKFETVPFD